MNCDFIIEYMSEVSSDSLSSMELNKIWSMSDSFLHNPMSRGIIQKNNKHHQLEFEMQYFGRRWVMPRGSLIALGFNSWSDSRDSFAMLGEQENMRGFDRRGVLGTVDEKMGQLWAGEENTLRTGSNLLTENRLHAREESALSARGESTRSVWELHTGERTWPQGIEAHVERVCCGLT